MSFSQHYISTAVGAAENSVSYLKEVFSSVSVIIVILFVVGLLVMVFAIIMMAVALKRSNKKAKPKGEAKLEKIHQTPPLGGLISEYLTRKGYFKVNNISLIFLKVLDFLRNTIGENYNYKLPWFVVLGGEGSGKTTLIESLDLNKPAGQPDLYDGHTDPDCAWHFFAQGVALDVKGKLFLNDQKSPTGIEDEKNWRNLLVLLTRYRGAKPLNGIILTIPAPELYSKHKLSVDVINARADLMMRNLNILQASLKMKLPIYVVITKSDIIPGFQSICSEIPAKNRHNLIGWSSPYHTSLVYTPRWLDEAFIAIQGQFEQLRIEILSEARLQAIIDGVFVFPNEAVKIRTNLAVYLNKIFHEDSYHEAPLLRGIYFCGDCGMTQLNQVAELNNTDKGDDFVSLEKNEEDSSLIDQEEVERRIFFINDLISLKVFLEAGIARPLSGKLISINRSLNILRASIMAFVVFGTYGLFNVYERFTQNRDYVVPVLSKMSLLLRDMQSIRIDEPGHSGPLFDIYARQLLDMMEQIQKNHFFSLLVPASWFSPLHKNLNDSLKVSYQTIVIRTIYIDLLLKARELLHLRPTSEDKTDNISQLLNPLLSKEYLLLKKYIEDLTILSDKIYKFNNLKKFPSASDLEDLVIYTFGSQLPPKFMDQYKHFSKVLMDTPFPDIDLKPYQQLSRNTLSVLYHNFLNALFNKNNSNSLASTIKTVINQVQRKESKHTIDLKVLREFSVNLTKASGKLGEAGKTWMDDKIFNPSKEFDQLLDKVDILKLFGKDVTQYLVDQTAIAFESFKEQLKALNLMLADNIEHIAAKAKELPCSYGIFILEKSLAALFAEPYMNEISHRKFITRIPVGQVISWDKNLIQAANDMVQKYEDYAVKHIVKAPVLLQEPFKVLAKKGLQESIVSIIGQAQSFTDIPKNLAPGVASEEILRSKIGDLQAVSQNFIKLMEILTHKDTGVLFLELKDLLNTSAFWLLAEVEKMLQAYTPYAVRNNDFSWWNGTPNAAIEAYSVRDLEDLKSYLQLQKHYIKTMTIDFAKPLVSFLSAEVMNDSNHRDKGILNRWRRIIEQYELNEKKHAGNSLSLLEDFILKELNTYDLHNCFDLISLKDLKIKTGDYFLEIIRDIKEKILAKAEILAREQAVKNYNILSKFFNENLKNRFPFVGSSLSDNQGEADPEKIREFFEKFKEVGGSAKSIFNQVYQLGDIAKEPMVFLAQMEQVQEFLSYYLDHQINDVPSLEFKIDFRVNRPQEKAGDMIVDWFFRPDEETIINKQDKTFTGRWKFGNPIQVGFKWPTIEAKEESAEEGKDVVTPQPIRDPEQVNLEIFEQSATFNYNNGWSLLWLLRIQAAPRASYSSIKDPNPYILRFKIPLVNNPKAPDPKAPTTYAIVYNMITLSVPPLKPKGSSKVIKVPDFPISAPAISREVLNLNDKPVLTKEIIKAKDFIMEDIQQASIKPKDKAKDDKKDTSKDQKVKDDKKVKNSA